MREHLAAVLSSPRFAKSQRLRRFLEFVVECKLAGRDEEIQEYAIGLEVFDRGVSFDPRLDSIVRVEARRLRDRLAEYYTKSGRNSPIRIVLPERGYVPSWERWIHPRRWIAKAATGVIAAVLAGLLLCGVPRPYSRPEPTELAREAFEKGLVAWQQKTGEGAQQAMEYFQQAVAHDPGYASAYAWLSASYRQQATMGDADPAAVYARAEEAARKAIALDPQLPEAYHSLAVNLTFKPDWRAAEKAFRLALRLEPENSNIHHAFGIVLLAASPERLAEAEAEIRRAVRLKPGDLDHRVVLGKLLYFRGRYPEARSNLEEVLKLDSHYPDGMRNLAAVLVQTGDQERAVFLYEEAQKLAYLRWGEGLLGHALAVSGSRVKARAILAELKSRNGTQPGAALAIATIHAGLEEWAEACAWMDRAWTGREIRARYLNVDPIYAPLRQQECFAGLLTKTGLAGLATPSN